MSNAVASQEESVQSVQEVQEVQERFLRIILADPELLDLEFEKIIREVLRSVAKTDAPPQPPRSGGQRAAGDPEMGIGSGERATPRASERAPPKGAGCSSQPRTRFLKWIPEMDS